MAEQAAHAAEDGWDLAWGPADDVSGGSMLSKNASQYTCRFKCPTLAEYPTEWSLWVLVVLYTGIALTSFVLLVRTSKRRSFRNLFLTLQCVLCLLRTLTFVIKFPKEEENMFVLLLVTQTTPIFLQFVTFSLLIVFLIKCLLSIQERSHLIYKVLYPSYALLVVALGYFSWFVSRQAATDYDNGEDKSGTHFDYGLSYYGSAVFGMLTLCVAITGYYTHRMLMRIVISEARHRQVIGVSYIIVMYCIIFCGRTVWSVTYILDKNYLQHLMNQWISNGNATNYYASMLCFYLVFEILPTSYLLRCFWIWLRPVRPSRKMRQLDHNVEVRPLLP